MTRSIWMRRCAACGVLRAHRDLVEAPGGELLCADCDERRDPIVLGGDGMHPLEEAVPDPCAEVCS